MPFKATQSLRANFMYALTGNLGFALFQYLILTVFVKGYSPEDVGSYHYANAFVMPLVLSFDLQLRSLYVTGTEPGHIFSYLKYRNVVNVLTVLLVVGGAFFVKPELMEFILALGVLKILENQTSLLYGLYHKQESLSRMAASRWLRSGSAFVVLALVAWIWHPSFIQLLWVYAGYSTLLFFVVDYRWSRQLLKGLTPVSLSTKQLVILTLPMLFIAMLEKYYVNYPRLMVEEYFGLEVIGIVGTLFYIRMIGSQMIVALSTATQSKYGEYLRDKNFPAFRRLVVRNIGLGAILGLAMTGFFYLTGPYLLPILFTEEYVAFNDTLALILLGSTVSFSYTFFGGAFNALRIHRLKVPVQAIAFVILVGLIYTRHASINEIMVDIIIAEGVILLGYVGIGVRRLKA